jgi:CRP-like cAMP-binding protein
MTVTLHEVSFVPLFRGMPPAEIERVLKFAAVESFSADRTLINEGAKSASLMYVILEGEVEILKRDATGRDILLSSLQRGQFFGEMALFTRAPRSATARSKTPVRLLMLARSNFERLMHGEPAVMQTFIQTMAQRLNETSEQLAAMEQSDTSKQAPELLQTGTAWA